jgi:hypothetical protein
MILTARRGISLVVGEAEFVDISGVKLNSMSGDDPRRPILRGCPTT